MLMQHMIQSGPAQIQSQVGGRIWSHSWRFKKIIDDKNPTLPLWLRRMNMRAIWIYQCFIEAPNKHVRFKMFDRWTPHCISKQIIDEKNPTLPLWLRSMNNANWTLSNDNPFYSNNVVIQTQHFQNERSGLRAHHNVMIPFLVLICAQWMCMKHLTNIMVNTCANNWKMYVEEVSLRIKNVIMGCS